MAPTVLVVTNREDGTADRVVHELDERGTPVMRFDAADFPQRLALAATCDENGWDGYLVGEIHSVRLSEVAGVYFRHPGQFALVEGMSGPERLWAYAEARMGFGGVVQALECAWVNHPQRIAVAEYKPVQFAAAVQSGLRVPRTFVGNDPGRLTRWAQRLGRPIVYKPLAGSVHVEDNTTHIVYTTPITEVSQLNDPALTLTAHYFQEWVDKAVDARVIIVGEAMFPVAIHTDSREGRVDWRADYASHHYEMVELPDHVRRALRSCLKRLGLTYGAADFAITPDGDWVFLGDLNPNGEWGWLAHHCGLPIAAAIAEELRKDLV